MGNFKQERKSFGGRNSSRRSFGGSSGGFGRSRDSGRFKRKSPDMHEAICDKCKKKCEVPFKPTGDKPVYCSECFNKNEKSGSSGISSNQLEELNKKLDKIISLLEKSNK